MFSERFGFAPPDNDDDEDDEDGGSSNQVTLHYMLRNAEYLRRQMEANALVPTRKAVTELLERFVDEVLWPSSQGGCDTEPEPPQPESSCGSIEPLEIPDQEARRARCALGLGVQGRLDLRDLPATCMLCIAFQRPCTGLSLMPMPL